MRIDGERLLQRIALGVRIAERPARGGEVQPQDLGIRLESDGALIELPGPGCVAGPVQVATGRVEHQRLLRCPGKSHLHEFQRRRGGLSFGNLVDCVGQGSRLGLVDRSRIHGVAGSSVKITR